MKILFIYDQPDEQYWQDGLFTAIEILKKTHTVQKVNIAKEKVLEDALNWQDCDFILGWGGFQSPVDNAIQLMTQITATEIPKGLCLAGNAFPLKTQKYDVIFYETEWTKQWLIDTAEAPVPTLVHAFGYNSKIMEKETEYDEPILWQYMTVGAFAKWKRQSKLLKKDGNRLAIGEIQKGNLSESMGIVGPLLMDGVMVSGMMSPWALAKFYHQTEYLYIPADIYGGGERAVIEAKACGTTVKVEDDNPKLQELLKSDTVSWTENYYAAQLENGIVSVKGK